MTAIDRYDDEWLRSFIDFNGFNFVGTIWYDSKKEAGVTSSKSNEGKFTKIRTCFEI